MDFTGKTAIVTGGAKGIGRGCVELFAENGANVVLADMNCNMATEVEQELKGRGLQVKAVKVNVKQVSDIEKMVNTAVESFGTVDILVNNAGIFHSTPVEDVTEEEWDNIMAINLKSVFFATQKVLPYMKKKHCGKILNLSSLAGRNGGIVNGLGYSAAKAGIIGLTRGFAARFAQHGINVNAIAPGSTDTGILGGLSAQETAELVAKIPLGRYGTVHEVASAVAFLCSDDASFITGAVLDVNGGMYFG
ncbi:MAG: SDR family NAD(P)-dependent oxidoreductase [Christensenella hongkongensis]|uniref:SDR family NAD(P)-dependent oxidoreductase n=1 Tax=Christensenella hongkongensis TaxID=270498 RepID=UPI002672D878|nr:SDR family NAD(P)-dependent oxidoreductase [Christensenella hongkongensis]MDY3003293.1 SDR family NAD(P)-dependent oxidoreductase [Christensenella hongkongensis]